MTACGSTAPASTPTAVPTATPSPLPSPTTTPSPFPTPITLSLSTRSAIWEYGEQCANILQNVPVSIVAHGTRAEFLGYLYDEWGKLVPPPSLTACHSAVRACYGEWRGLPEGTEPDPNGPIAKHAMNVTLALDRYTLETLEATGCIGG